MRVRTSSFAGKYNHEAAMNRAREQAKQYQKESSEAQKPKTEIQKLQLQPTR